MRVALLLSLLIPSVAQAAPFDLQALRAEWRGYPYVVLEQHHEFELVGDDLKVTTRRELAILTDAARNELSLFEAKHRPGCREPGGIEIVTVGPDDAELRVAEDDLARIRLADHSNPERATVDIMGPRKGIQPGALLRETQHVVYPRGCYAGLLATERRLGDPLGPVLEETATVSCLGSGCSYAFDRDHPAAEGAVVYRAQNVEPLPPESHGPDETRLRLFVSSSDDPMAVAATLEDLLDAAVPAAARVAGSYAAAAKKDHPEESDAAARTARYLSSIPALNADAFWLGGFDPGEPPKADSRPVLPLEWWAITTAALRSAGGIPILLDSGSDLPPPSVGNVTTWDEVAVLVPGRFVVTRDALHPLTAHSAVGLAGRYALHVTDTPEIQRFDAGAELDHQRWTGTIELTAGDYLKYDLSADVRGSTAANWRSGYLGTMGRWKKASKKRRSSEAERDRAFVRRRVLGRDVSVGTVHDEAGVLDALTVGVLYSRAGEVQRGEGVSSLVVPLPLEPELADVVSPGDRHRPLRLDPVDVALDVVIKTPEGHTLAGLPSPISITEGPVHASCLWSETPEGVRLQLAYTVDEAVLEPGFAEAVHRAGEALRRASNPYVLFVQTP